MDFTWCYAVSNISNHFKLYILQFTLFFRFCFCSSLFGTSLDSNDPRCGSLPSSASKRFTMAAPAPWRTHWLQGPSLVVHFNGWVTTSTRQREVWKSKKQKRTRHKSCPCVLGTDWRLNVFGFWNNVAHCYATATTTKQRPIFKGKDLLANRFDSLFQTCWKTEEPNVSKCIRNWTGDVRTFSWSSGGWDAVGNHWNSETKHIDAYWRMIRYAMNRYDIIWCNMMISHEITTFTETKD